MNRRIIILLVSGIILLTACHGNISAESTANGEGGALVAKRRNEALACIGRLTGQAEPVCGYYDMGCTAKGQAAAFVFTGTKTQEEAAVTFRGSLWYLDRRNCILLKNNIQTLTYGPVILAYEKEKHLLYTETGAMPDSSSSYLWTVKDGRPELLLETPNYIFMDNGQLAIVRTFLSSSANGRIWQRYYLYWDNEAGRYQEYTGTAMTEDEFLSYENAPAIKEEIESAIIEDLAGCREPAGADTLKAKYIRRGNGMININYEIICKDNTYYCYAILTCSEGKVILEDRVDYHIYEWGYLMESGDFNLSLFTKELSVM